MLDEDSSDAFTSKSDTNRSNQLTASDDDDDDDIDEDELDKLLALAEADNE